MKKAASIAISIPRLLRDEVRSAAQSRCALCLAHTLGEIDHVIPVAIGGSNDADNLRLLCPWCHRKETDRFKALLGKARPTTEAYTLQGLGLEDSNSERLAEVFVERFCIFGPSLAIGGNLLNAEFWRFAKANRGYGASSGLAGELIKRGIGCPPFGFGRIRITGVSLPLCDSVRSLL